MKRALELAKRGQYAASPNPMVGCVIVKDGNIVGEGWHKGKGLAHAEVEALNQAGTHAHGADLYVNLEPCCHQGNTPPCTVAIIASQIKTVHAAMSDPNPLVNGQGIAALKKAGISVQLGEEKAAAEQLNESFIHWITRKMPFVIAKWAMTFDGRIAANSGHAKWVTGENARLSAHDLRQSVDAILVGAQTVIQDNPQLTARLPSEHLSQRQPLRIILDAKGLTPTAANVYECLDGAETMVVTSSLSPDSWQQQLTRQGVSVRVMQAINQTGMIDILSQLLPDLGQLNITRLLIEGGANVLTQLFKWRLVNKFYVYVAPKMIGGKFSAIGDLALEHMDAALPLQIDSVEKLGSDYLFVGYVKKGME
jgi:diaminohydroxyphosphoribosylaminopyrimidine deaminase/5-amino-6-(5-phosphoribosylamino)uracil reductase